MSEFNRVAEAVDTFLASDAYDGDVSDLLEVAQHTVIDGYRRYQELREQSAETEQLFSDLQKKLSEFSETQKGAQLRDDLIDLFRSATEARRSTYDLTDPDRPWEQLTVAAAVDSEDDLYTFPIVDTIVDKIDQLIDPKPKEQTPPAPASAAVVETYNQQLAKEKAERTARQIAEAIAATAETTETTETAGGGS